MIVWKERLKASGIHLGISVAIALCAALLVFLVWYPYPYREISGGRELFLILVSVDVILGPLITLSIFDRRKPVSELTRDLAIVGAIQLAALGYGLWTMSLARPVHLVFEVDRFRVVHAVDVPQELLGQQPADVEPLPLTGPTLLAVRPFRDSKESMEATMAALGGVHLSARPDLWQSYEASRKEVLQAAKPVSQLKERFASRAAEIDSLLRSGGREAGTLVYLPLTGRDRFWTAFIDPRTADVVAFLPLDPF